MEKLPTKKEVMEELEDDARVFRKHFGKTHDIEIKDVDAVNKFKWILFKPKPLYPNAVAGAVFEYRPEHKPPERLAAVLLRYCHYEETIVGVSKGTFDEDGDLQCFPIRDDIDEDFGWVFWKCIKTGEHSGKWKDEWTPEEFRK